MKELLTNFKNQWAQLPERSRQLASAGGILVAVLLLYTAIWAPLQKDVARLRTSVPRDAADLTWMRMQAPIAKTMRAKTSTTTSGMLLPAVEQSATAYGVRSFITKIEGEGNNGARVSLDAVPFTSFVTWISEMQASQGAIVEDASIEALATPGVVNVRLRLRTGGA